MRKSLISLSLALVLVVAVAATLAPAGFAKEPGDGNRGNLPPFFDRLSNAGQLWFIRHNDVKPRFKHHERPQLPTTRQLGQTSADEKACVNILVNNPPYMGIYGDNETQSTTAITLAGNGRVVVAYNDSSWDGLAYPYENRYTSWALSINGGATFQDCAYMGYPLPWNPEGDYGNPCLGRDPFRQRVYLSTQSYFTGQQVQIFRSLNDGLYFSDVRNATPGHDEGYQDKPWIAVDTFSGPGQGNVYCAFRHFSYGSYDGIRFTRSTDGGDTWGPNIGTLLCNEGFFGNVNGANVVVGKDHAVYVFWLDEYVLSNYRRIYMRKSTDQGVTWGLPVRVCELNNQNNFYNGDLQLTGGFRTNCWPQAAVNRATGAIYVVYNDWSVYNTLSPADCYITYSTNGGAAWSTPAVVDQYTTRDQWQPSIAITPDGMRIFVGMYTRNLDFDDEGLVNTSGRIGTINRFTGAISWGREFLITQDDFPVVVGQDLSVPGTYWNDYNMATADTNYFYYAWGDDRLPGYNEHQPDVRMTKVPVGGPGGVLFLYDWMVPTKAAGVIEPNECNEFVVDLCNFGTAPVYGINAVLTTTTPGVTITRPGAGFDDVAPGLCVDNSLTPFLVSTSPTFVCGQEITFILQVATAYDGTFFFTIEVPTGTAVVTPFATSSAMPMAIPDGTGAPAAVQFTVAGLTSDVSEVQVSMYITHSWRSDLYIELGDPAANFIMLSAYNGGWGSDLGTACAPEADRLTFSDEGAQSIVDCPTCWPPSPACNVIGLWRPEQALANFAGYTPAQANGVWTMNVWDDYAGFGSGSVECATLFMSYVNCDPGTGVCPSLPIYDQPPAYDDYSRSAVCADGFSGHYAYTLRPVGGPLTYEGQASVIYYDGWELVLRSIPGDPKRFYYHRMGTYVVSNFLFPPSGVSSALIDQNTLDSPWLCP